MKLCSACLLGMDCKDNGGNNKDKKVLKLAKKEILIPVCPEQFGGLPTPREKSARNGRKKVVTESGKDVTKNFIKGAEEILKIAKIFGIKEAILKQRSPSCGSGQIYDETFLRKIIKGDGVTVALLKRNGIKVISEEDL
ncbi:DUF523 domain-containing protein [Patescibacteria group bacterium]|nr:DUF523 domain-containing protein [Patescibacteria group bacterium]MBU4579873.1 DUF523 domain-containing protein [Patescibacteria group bacterium]